MQNFRIDFASENSYFKSRTNSHSGANTISGVNPDSFSGENCDFQVDSDSRADSRFEVDSGIGYEEVNFDQIG